MALQPQLLTILVRELERGSGGWERVLVGASPAPQIAGQGDGVGEGERVRKGGGEGGRVLEQQVLLNTRVRGMGRRGA